MDTKKIVRNRALKMLALCTLGIGLNLLGNFIVRYFEWPLYLDSLGTILVSVMSGYLPGVLIGLLTNMIMGLYDSVSIYYAVVNVLFAIAASWFTRKGYLRKFWGPVLLIIILAVLGGGHGSVLNWLINDAWVGMPYLHEGLAKLFLWDLLDKALTVVVVMMIYQFLPDGAAELLNFVGWQQTPLSKEQEKEVKKTRNRRVSLRTKILWLLIMAGLSVGIAAMVISVLLYQDYTIKEHYRLADGTARLAAKAIDPEMVERFMQEGESLPEYRLTEERLLDIRESSPDILYVYVYQIKPDGCHVVFDLDTEDLEGEEPGTLIAFDESFTEYIPTLLEGGEIEPIISDDTYGYLITVYVPVYNSKGDCVCYAAADISMGLIRNNEISFMAKLLSLFAAFFIVMLAVGFWISEYNIVLPINTMSQSASAFVYDNEQDLEANLEQINKLDIHTGDEIENMYHAFSVTTENNLHYAADLQAKNETISQMQNALILVLADMVENRDEETGDHVRKTAAYTRIIMDKMREMGYYATQLTNEFIYNVENSAPLHDIGKIAVSDRILNKPDRLTDEEFKEMQRHTTAGAEILQRVIDTVPDSGYLKEAKNLAEFHHEKWNGKGYPHGIAGEEIPLSARIMAVADVFDALVSERCYKKAFPFEKALSIIEEDAGKHFDPLVAKAFVLSEGRVRDVAEHYGKRKAAANEEKK